MWLRYSWVKIQRGADLFHALVTSKWRGWGNGVNKRAKESLDSPSAAIAS